MINKFYIYAHINPFRNEIFYIGKGIKRRAFLKSGRSLKWHNIVNKYGYIIDIIENELSEELAFDREIFYIKRIGRSDLGLGTLVNLTNGGDGVSGRKCTQAHKDILSKLHKGTTLSKEHKAKLSKARQTRIITQETKDKMSKSQMGHSVSQETKDKIGKAHRGKIVSKKTRNRISKWNRGRKLSQETKDKIALASKNISKETRDKMSKSRIGSKNALKKK